MNIDSIPIELQFQILSYLTSIDLLNIGLINKEFNLICKDKILWHNLYLRDKKSCSFLSETDYQNMVLFLSTLLNKHTTFNSRYYTVHIDIVFKDLYDLLLNFIILHYDDDDNDDNRLCYNDEFNELWNNFVDIIPNYRDTYRRYWHSDDVAIFLKKTFTLNHIY